VVGPFEGSAAITLLATNPALQAVHGDSPRENPEFSRGGILTPLTMSLVANPNP